MLIFMRDDATVVTLETAADDLVFYYLCLHVRFSQALHCKQANSLCDVRVVGFC